MEGDAMKWLCGDIAVEQNELLASKDKDLFAAFEKTLTGSVYGPWLSIP